MMPSVNPKPPFTSCNFASGDTSASSAGSSLATAGLSSCARALAGQAPRVTANRIAAETENFSIKRPSNPTVLESRRDPRINLLARRAISKHPRPGFDEGLTAKKRRPKPPFRCPDARDSIAEPLGDRGELLLIADFVALVADVLKDLLSGVRLVQAEDQLTHFAHILLAHLARGDQMLDRHRL